MSPDDNVLRFRVEVRELEPSVTGEGEERPRPGAWDVIVACVLLGVGTGCLVGGKVALGVLTLLLLAGQIVGLVTLRRGSETAVFVYAVARPLFLGGWLLAVAGVIFLSNSSSEWIVFLAFAVLWIGLGIALVVATRVREKRRKDE
jgi:hypothetical protein